MNYSRMLCFNFKIKKKKKKLKINSTYRSEALSESFGQIGALQPSQMQPKLSADRGIFTLFSHNNVTVFYFDTNVRRRLSLQFWK